MRQNLRSLKTSVKANLIKGNDFDLTALSRPSSSKSAPGSMKDKDKQADRPTHRRGTSEADIQYETDDGKKAEKRGRTRSRTFTFTKNRSSSKKHKAEGSVSSKSVNLPKSPSLVSLVNGKRGSYIGESSKQSVPEDFVSYLRAEQQPQQVEVGKIHRLRQILRNETVSWVETFIKLGGMIEIVELLHRIMRIEWRQVYNLTFYKHH
jgi:hypothetical protein